MPGKPLHHTCSSKESIDDHHHPRKPTPRTGHLPGPKAAALVARDDQVISPSYTRSYPLVIDHGRGSEVWDVDGNRFIDFTAGVAVLATGHAHPDVVKAIQDQASPVHPHGRHRLLPAGAGRAGRDASAAITPGDYDKQVFFTNSGTEFNEAAMKLCHYYTGRPCFISFLGAFHGRTYGSMSLSSSKALHRTHYQPLRRRRLPCPVPESLPPAVRQRADRAPGPRLRGLHRAHDDPPPGQAARMWPGSLSRRSRARAAMSSAADFYPALRGAVRQVRHSAGDGRGAVRAWAAPARCSRSSTGTWCPT